MDPLAPAAAAPLAPAAVSPVAAPVVAAPAAPAPTLSATIAGAFAALRGKAALGTDLAAARTEIAALNEKLLASASDLAASGSQLSALNSQLSAIAGFFGVPVADLAGKDAAAAAALFSARVSAAAIDQVAAIGHPIATLPAPSETAGSPEAQKILTASEFSALSNAQKMEFARHDGRIAG